MKGEAVRQFFIGSIWDYFQTEARTHLPWRVSRDPYAICVSEFMLQQTQVERVIPKYEAWLSAFPTWEVLAAASTADVLRLWSGLGYNSRALRLKQLAETVVTRYQGVLPQSGDDLEALPGIGPYTTAALQAFAFEQEVAVVDTNIERIVLRFFLAAPAADREIVVVILEEMLREQSYPLPFARYFFQALMDFGSQICKAKPLCQVCPLRSQCKAFATQQFAVKRPKQSHFPHSRRYYRGLLLKLLKDRDQLSWTELAAIDIQGYQWSDVVATLAKDGLITVHEKNGRYVTLPR
ncbi:A/G-specific adenine glycosylase [Candidatus Gracilibacteria bacterium]|nr:A/G-specific adenine glycosylase [Candidatus Gracilibacteria bacterium]